MAVLAVLAASHQQPVCLDVWVQGRLSVCYGRFPVLVSVFRARGLLACRRLAVRPLMCCYSPLPR